LNQSPKIETKLPNIPDLKKDSINDFFGRIEGQVDPNKPLSKNAMKTIIDDEDFEFKSNEKEEVKTNIPITNIKKVDSDDSSDSDSSSSDDSNSEDDKNNFGNSKKVYDLKSLGLPYQKADDYQQNICPHKRYIKHILKAKKSYDLGQSYI